MAARARLTPPRVPRRDWPWHTAKASSLPVSVIFKGDRRLEAENYLSDGHGTRTAVETKTFGWQRFSKVARAWQPSRLKGIQVSSEFGTPFLAATQVYDVRPVARKWLSLAKTDNVKERYVNSGAILLTRSGDVGRATLAHSTLQDHLISDDLLRIEPFDAGWSGWIYAYLRAPTVRAILKAAQYGHIIKHLEVGHVADIPIVDITPKEREAFQDRAKAILDKRDDAHRLTLEAEKRFEEAFGALNANDLGEKGFVAKADKLFLSGRRRLDAWHHNPSVDAIRQHLSKSAMSWEAISSLGYKAWLPTRFRRIPAEDGILFMDSADLFEMSPDITKRIADQNFGDPYNARVRAGWLLLARSGQIYGLNGTAMMSGSFHENKIISDHIIRIAPDNPRCRLGYLFVAMTHPSLGRPRVKALPYGSSIPEIEVEDIKSLSIPRLAQSVEDEIAQTAEDAARLRSEADELELSLAEDAELIITRFLASHNA